MASILQQNQQLQQSASSFNDDESFSWMFNGFRREEKVKTLT